MVEMQFIIWEIASSNYNTKYLKSWNYMSFNSFGIEFYVSKAKELIEG